MLPPTANWRGKPLKSSACIALAPSGLNKKARLTLQLNTASWRKRLLRVHNATTLWLTWRKQQIRAMPKKPKKEKKADAENNLGIAPRYSLKGPPGYRNPVLRSILPAIRRPARMPEARNGFGSDVFHQA
jgi:hypothetical protein